MRYAPFPAARWDSLPRDRHPHRALGRTQRRTVSPSHDGMLASSSQCRAMMGESEGERLRTVDCLRARLLAERVASKAAKEEAESLAKRLEELERKLDEETKCMNRAEKRLKLALKKLEALKDARSQLTLQDSSSSSSSFQDSSLSPQRLEQEKPGALSTVDSQRFGSMEVAKEMLRSSSSEDLLGDNVSGTGSSSICLHQPLISHDEGSCSSVGTAQSQNEDGIQVIGAQQSPADDMSITSGSDAEPETAIRQAEREDRMLAIVPASVQLNLEACRPEVKEVQGVLDALRNIKVQLLYSMRILVSQGNSRGAAFCCQSNQV
ncbi:hypothetical protein C4D60_Mb06t09640 [Musa balbisiana]|uniref:Uncharacterized protein n=1 Tax=Musa balbisiana TaxID=52838 RepID=A0A4S8ILW4_MUSBA|nr:hypothetical protein C4D60_Mb06t09640 [Musa balbisiana]